MLSLGAPQCALGAASGSLVGFALGTFGGGGSILAVPLMAYLVGVTNPHVAIGTSAFAVAVNAATGVVGHARHGAVRWRCAIAFSAAGIVGAAVGSTVGKAVNGQKLLLMFALFMIVVGIMMLRKRRAEGDTRATLDRANAAKVLGVGGATGALSGFFGIGGGFLIVPSLMASTGMPIINAVGTSLVAVFAFSLTTAISYALSGLVSWPLALVFVLGGVIGNLLGTCVARRLSTSKGRLNATFAALIFAAASYMIYRGVHSF